MLLHINITYTITYSVQIKKMHINIIILSINKNITFAYKLRFFTAKLIYTIDF